MNRRTLLKLIAGAAAADPIVVAYGAIKYRIAAFPSQRRFYELDCPWAGFSGSVGSGKSFALCYKALHLASENEGCRGVLAAPTYKMLLDSTVPAMLSILEEHHIPHTWAGSRMVLTLPRSNSTILFRSLEKFDRIRGLNLAWFGIDELTYCTRGAMEVLQGRLRDPKAKKIRGFAVWTPKGFDWVYDRFISPIDKKEGYEAVIAAPGENLAVLKANPQYYEQLKAGYDDAFYRQEVLGEYLNIFSGRVYHAYDAAKQDAPAPLTFTPHSPLRWALDFNLDPMSSCLVQDLGGVINVLDEISLRGATINQMCDEFVRCTEPMQKLWAETNGRPFEVVVYGDAAAEHGNNQTGKSDYAAIKEYFRGRSQFKLLWNTNISNPPVKDRCAAVNRMLCDASGKVRMIVDKRCKELRSDFLKVSWKPNANGFEIEKKSDAARTHMSDALGYLVYRDYKMDGFYRELVLN